MSRIPYEYYNCLNNAEPAPTFDAEAAYGFLEKNGDILCNTRMAHWRGEISDADFWQVLSQYQGINGGFKGGLDPDYTGNVGSIHSTIDAMRIMVAHQQFEGPYVDKTLDFLRSTVLPDGSWQEIPEVLANPHCPEWYQPAQFRIYETACLVGYGLELGAADLWAGAIRYIRQSWMDMPFSETAHPYWAVLLFLGRSTHSSDRSIALDALDNLGVFIRRHKLDAYDCSTVVEILSGLEYPEVNDMFVRILDMLGAAQDPDDGGIRTEYGDALRPSATFNALMAIALMMERGIVDM